MRRSRNRYAWSAGAMAAVMALFLTVAGRAETQPVEQARDLWEKGVVLHLYGAYEVAADYFRQSIEAHPTAEGHTYLGWSLSRLGRIEEAIAECKKAIRLDPDFGNPYNDIGVYLFELGRADEAIPWFRKAMAAKRYCCYQFPHFNMGRILLNKGRDEAAAREFRRALSYDPNYLPARVALEYLQKRGKSL